MTKWFAALLLALIAAPVQAQQPAIDPSLPRVAIDTTAGRFIVTVEVMKAPITAANFLHYVDQHRLDGVVFYRTVKVADHFGFVQFGVDNDPKRVLPPIAHEPTTQTGLPHIDGTLSLARLAPGPGRGDFTIGVGDQRYLDADPTKPGDNLGYATFARVTEGMDVVLKIFDAPVSPTKTQRGAFKGEVPETPVTVITARRLP
ncbi:peptidylprolyl isomerase [Sphingomonas bacterium]|uniref:peptidylprolyl isomerase n=1 Tax=Sphingomonas bacterium TaxID=1895847 RepID=UPI0015762E32|nr:peptidylprolyl isomerase [Sphingomonas bacterium]